MATDYMLAGASIVFSILAWRKAGRVWGLMFLFTAAGSFFGGTFHGIGPAYGIFITTMLWKATAISVGLASFFLLIAAVQHRSAPLFALLLFVAYASWMITHSNFLWVVIDYGVTFLVVAIVHAVLWIRGQDRASWWIVMSFVVCLLAAGVQQSRLLAGPLNHNDLYHLVQIAALSLLFRGAMLMTWARARSTIPPT